MARSVERNQEDYQSAIVQLIRDNFNINIDVNRYCFLHDDIGNVTLIEVGCDDISHGFVITKGFRKNDHYIDLISQREEECEEVGARIFNQFKEPDKRIAGFHWELQYG